MWNSELNIHVGHESTKEIMGWWKTSKMFGESSEGIIEQATNWLRDCVCVPRLTYHKHNSLLRIPFA